MQNIVFLLHRYPGLGGIETVTTTIANYLINFGFNIHFYSITSEKGFNKLDKRIKIYNSKQKDIFKQSNEFTAYCYENKIDCIILHDNYDIKLEFITSAIIQLQCKFIVVEHSDPMGTIEGVNRLISRKKHGNFLDLLWLIKNRNYKNDIIKDYLYRKNKLFDICDRYIVLSNSFKESMKNCISNFNESKLLAINNPLTVPIIQCEKSKNIVVFIARLEGSKRIDYLISILKEIAPKYLNWEFHIYGDGAERITVEKFIKKMRLSNLKFYGPTNNVSSVLQTAKVLLMTSEYEGWGLVLTEAMANGVVPIAFDSYLSIHDIIDNMINGILVHPFNLNEYCSKLSVLLDDNNMYLKMHNNVYSKAFLFKIDNQIGDQWLTVLNSI